MRDKTFGFNALSPIFSWCLPQSRNIQIYVFSNPVCVVTVYIVYRVSCRVSCRLVLCRRSCRVSSVGQSKKTIRGSNLM